MTTTKNCPYCDELISINAIKCKHCGSLLNDSVTPSANMDSYTHTKISLAARFEILNEIGRGGMATVYRAVQKNLQRTVALKVIHQNLIHDKEFLERFHSEARLAASLNHPNIVAIYDEGIENGVHFISMEYLDGEDLHRKIKTRGKLSIDQTVQVISSIAESLDHIHKKGLIHRDIKTSNIIITSSGRAVLTDFGIARAISGSKLSQTGSVLGTPEYMSPEQADGLRAEPRSDLYSLGIVMYECLTGILPFSGENPVATIYKIINSPHPPLSRFNSSVPDWLQSITDKSLAKNPHNRFSSGKEFSTALKEQKIVSVVDRHFIPPRTQKFDVKEKLIESSPKENIRQLQNRKTKKKEIRTADRSNSKPVYFIGGVIIILLIVIAGMLFQDFILGSRNREDLIKDAQWATLNESDKSQVLSLIESGDEYLENNKFIQPPGNNAYEKFKEILKIHSTNSYASIQLEKIFSEMYKEASTELANGNIDKANYLVSQLREYFPDKEDKLIILFQNNEISRLLNESQQLLSRSTLSISELSQIFANVSTVLSRETDNEIARNYMSQLESKYSQLGEEYFSSNQFQNASQVYQQARENFPNNDTFVKRFNDCRSRLEVESSVTVPSVIGMNESEAAGTISSAGLRHDVIRVSRAGDKGTVTGQNPGGGDRARRNSTVYITVIQ